MTTQCELNPKVVPLKQRLEARKGEFRQGTRRPDLGWKSKPITYHLAPTRFSDSKLIAKIHQGRASLEVQKGKGEREHVGACSFCSYGSLMVKIPPISYGAPNAMGEPRHMQVHQGAALGQKLGGPINMKLGQVWEPPIANLSVSCLVLIGIKNSREIPRLQGLSFQVQKATHIPKTSKLQALLRFLSCKIGYLSDWNLKTMTQKRRLLEGQPKGAIQKGFHRPFPLAYQLQTTDIERPIGQQLRVFTHRQQARVWGERTTRTMQVAGGQIRTAITETLQLEQVGTKFRAGSTRAQRNQLPGITTHSYHSPQSVKHGTLLNRRGPPELLKRRPSSKEHEIQNQSPDIQKTLLGQSPKSLLGKSRATAPKAIQMG